MSQCNMNMSELDCKIKCPSKTYEPEQTQVFKHTGHIKIKGFKMAKTLRAVKNSNIQPKTNSKERSVMVLVCFTAWSLTRKNGKLVNYSVYMKSYVKARVNGGVAICQLYLHEIE